MCRWGHSSRLQQVMLSDRQACGALLSRDDFVEINARRLRDWQNGVKQHLKKFVNMCHCFFRILRAFAQTDCLCIS